MDWADGGAYALGRNDADGAFADTEGPNARCAALVAGRVWKRGGCDCGEEREEESGGLHFLEQGSTIELQGTGKR